MGVTGVEIVAGVIATFFVIGIVCGVNLVMALLWKKPSGPDDYHPPRSPGRRG
jgi:hypothetical protein